MTEAQWQQRVMDAAQFHGWLVCHLRAVKVDDRWLTPYSGDSGLPDLILAKAGVIMLRELKTVSGRVAPEQKRWLVAGGRIWRPQDWDTVVLPELKGQLVAL